MTEEKLTVEEMEPEVEAPCSTEKNWEEEAQRFQDLYLRCAAETDNMRRRFQKEREEHARFASEKVVRGLLPVLDNLRLALTYVCPDSGPEVLSLAEGVRLTLKGFEDVLADNGIKAVPAERGQAFDPNFHEALGHCPETEIAPGTISHEIQRGYTLYDRLVRPSKVMVAAAG